MQLNQLIWVTGETNSRNMDHQRKYIGTSIGQDVILGVIITYIEPNQQDNGLATGFHNATRNSVPSKEIQQSHMICTAEIMYE